MRAAFFFFTVFFCTFFTYGASNPARLVISSYPPGARIALDSVPTGKKTPCSFDSLSPGLHEVIVQLRDYCFERRIVELIPGTKTDLSLRLIAISNAQKVHGSDRIGALILPETPVDSAYRIDDDPAWPGTVILEPGPHRVVWNGGPRYLSLDTTLRTDTGRATLLSFTPRERLGRLVISCDPGDALLLVDKARVDQPLDSQGVHAGSVRITALRTRYKELDTTIFLPPGDTVRIALALLPSNDIDDDNFLDAVDLCPEEFGTFDGCPERKKRAGFHLQMRTLKRATHDAPLSFMVDIAKGEARSPTRPDFGELYSLCSDGEPFFTGGSGVSLVNAVHASWRALRVSFERGQSLLGREYRKDAVAFVPFNNDTGSSGRYGSRHSSTQCLAVICSGNWVSTFNSAAISDCIGGVSP